jgi:beta-glucosidase
LRVHDRTVIPQIAPGCAALLADFGAHDDAALGIVFAKHNPASILPFEMPSSMKAVETQFEDVPFDSENPVFPFGHGLSYD